MNKPTIRTTYVVEIKDGGVWKPVERRCSSDRKTALKEKDEHVKWMRSVGYGGTKARIKKYQSVPSKRREA